MVQPTSAGNDRARRRRRHALERHPCNRSKLLVLGQRRADNPRRRNSDAIPATHSGKHSCGTNCDQFAILFAGGAWTPFLAPIAPSARVSLDLCAPDLRWSGRGYFDTNDGMEPLEYAFSKWTWLRASLRDGTAILYDAERRRESPLSLALRFDALGRYESVEPPPSAPLPPTGWRVARQTRSDDGKAFVERGFEDTPFYARSLVSTSLCGERVAAMHESLSLDRFANPIVRVMLPFRMPRRV